ncbi:MAG: DUF1049 domain-containing protein [Candidatus Aminicenantes bacterium]|nr:DUF1049 domain-containing protein [Candidatus Aminicenantes bacterium]NIM79996.1 DUF1049 domain-containing protein [Candidatus Aminicenantes bacterium]NIN19350.1 DUF1049 domain-containing protein [Candidatus Aminicenantes bacterium]NIN43249.1 DUF1049 domain-containing protein [Candidatus Aminicenantes bacterium]NIN85991.1 DUF1049 domain-containing protein [Candidatus Aminicenantes bacterium]
MKFIAGVIFGILVVIFIIQNTEIVEINFLFWTFSIPRALMVFIVFIIGMLLGALLKSLDDKRKAVKAKTDASTKEEK